jgi:probable rRNA maturation factor
MELRKNLILRSPPFETPPAAAPRDRRGRLEGRTTPMPPEPAVSVEVAVDCDGWLAACPEAAALAATAARAALAVVGTTGAPAILGLILTDDSEQRRLNRTYRGTDAPTNVLAFALSDPATPAPAGSPVLLGDVVLAFETIEREAAGQNKKLADHLAHLTVHGVLHLLGFDHQNEAEAAAMEAREVEILKIVGVADPYRDIM